MQPNISRIFARAQRAHAGGDLAKAERLYNALLQYRPGDFGALHGLGLLHYQRGRLTTALVLLQSALRTDLNRTDGFADLGLVFHALRQFDEALASYDKGLRLAPENAELLNRRGVALLDLDRPHEALADFERIFVADPDHLDALGNCGNALIKLNRPVEALARYDRALALAPENAQLLTNRAVALRRLDRPQEALMSARRALKAKPDFAQAKFVESVACLTLGDFTAGWSGYERRWSVGALARQRRSFTAPLWLGNEPLVGKTILLHAEQGFGDTLQFVRYAPFLRRRGARRTILEVQPELVRLLSGMADVDAIIARGDTLPPFDLYCPLLSLPLAFATQMATIPADIPYVVAAKDDAAPWRAQLPSRGPIVGLAWSGERSHDNDLNRSMRLDVLLPLLALPNITFVSLQYEMREADMPVLQAHPQLVQLPQKFRDFADTAAVIAALDAVVSVDSAVAHLTGAMGKPLFLLLPFGADFRWLRERQDSPWYPTARLYRQPQFGDWQSVIAKLSQDLMRANAFAASNRLSA